MFVKFVLPCDFCGSNLGLRSQIFGMLGCLFKPTSPTVVTHLRSKNSGYDIVFVFVFVSRKLNLPLSTIIPKNVTHNTNKSVVHFRHHVHTDVVDFSMTSFSHHQEFDVFWRFRPVDKNLFKRLYVFELFEPSPFLLFVVCLCRQRIMSVVAVAAG
jgi:hypothetical protein